MKTLQLTTFALALLLAAATAQAVWIGATAGATNDDNHEYTNTNNWENGVIDDVLPNTFTGKTTLYFAGDHATGPEGMTLNYLGYEHTFQKVGAVPQTLTLNGDFTFNGDNSSVILSYINLDLGGGTRIFNNSANSLYRWYGDIVNGSIVKEGTGRFAVYGTKNFQGSLTVNGGSFYTQQATVLKYGGPTYVNNASMLFYVYGSAPNTTSIVVTATTSGSSFSSPDMQTGVERLDDDVEIVLVSAASGNAQATFTHRVDTKDNDAVERIGRLVLRSGQSKLVHGVNTYNQNNQFIRLNAGGIVRENKSTLGVYNPSQYADKATYATANLGMRREVEGLYKCGNQIFLDTPPVMYGGPLTARGTDAPVIPFILGANFVTNGNPSTTLNTLITHDPATGLRAMRTRTDLLGNPSEFVETLVAADADGKDNARIAANETFSGETTVNALALAGGTLTLGAGGRVSLGSGLLAFVGGTLSATDGSVIDAGDREGIVFNGSSKSIGASLAGTGGYTFSTFNGSVKITGTNSYSGLTTIVSGTLETYRLSNTPHNASLPDDGLVLIHPGATLQIGYYQSDYRTREVIGGVAGGGMIRLGHISDTDPERWRGLAIGEGGTVEPGFVTLDGGVIAPGMPGEVGTLRVTTEANAAGTAIPVIFKKGALEIDITGVEENDTLSVMGDVTFANNGELLLDVDVNGFDASVGQEWTIITSEGMISETGIPFNKITDNSERVDFSAQISMDGKSVILTAVPDRAATLLVIR